MSVKGHQNNGLIAWLQSVKQAEPLTVLIFLIVLYFGYHFLRYLNPATFDQHVSQHIFNLGVQTAQFVIGPTPSCKWVNRLSVPFSKLNASP